MNANDPAVAAIVKGIIANARSLGLVWTMRLATATQNGDSWVPARFDGDTAIMSMVNMTGTSVTTNERLYVLVVPPGGNYIVGRVNVLAAAEATSGGIVLLGANADSGGGGNLSTGSEVVYSGWEAQPTLDFGAGRLYRLTATAWVDNAASCRVRIRKGTTTGGTQIAIGTSPVGINTFVLIGYAQASSAVSTQIALTIFSASSAEIGLGAAASVTVEDIGAVADYPDLAVVAVSI